jgi:hypothetical protein
MPIRRTRLPRRPTRATKVSPSITRVTLALYENHAAADPALGAAAMSRVTAVAAK